MDLEVTKESRQPDHDLRMLAKVTRPGFVAGSEVTASDHDAYRHWWIMRWAEPLNDTAPATGAETPAGPAEIAESGRLPPSPSLPSLLDEPVDLRPAVAPGVTDLRPSLSPALPIDGPRRSAKP